MRMTRTPDDNMAKEPAEVSALLPTAPVRIASAVTLRPLLLAAVLCALLTLPVAWNASERINHDGVSYIEIASNGLNSSLWYIVSNAYWSPAYPALIAVAFKLTHPSLYSELAVVHGLDWMICFGAYLAFTFFLYQLLRWMEQNHAGIFANRSTLYALIALGYALIFTGNIDPSLWEAGPNVLVEGAVLLAAALCVRISLPGSRPIHYVALGLALGFAYICKAVLFPLSIVLLGLFFVRPLARGIGRRGTAIAAVTFLLASSPLVLALSKTKGRLTFGDSGTLNYDWLVLDLKARSFWQGQLPAAGAPLHPPRTIATYPEILKFEGGPPNASFPYWYDPSYWWDGVRTHFDLKRQLHIYKGALGLDRMARHDGESVFQLGERWLPLFAGIVALWFLGLRRRRLWSTLGVHKWLLVWPAITFLIFASVVIEIRYLIPFSMLAWTATFAAAVTVTDSRKSVPVLLTVAAFLLLSAAPSFVNPAGRFVLEKAGFVKRSKYAAFTHADAARELKKLGIRPGDQLAAVEFPMYIYYARLTGTSISFRFETPPEQLAKLPAETVERALDVLRANGVKAVVCMGHPGFNNDRGWIHISNSVLYLRPL
jgi:hypothetical protein